MGLGLGLGLELGLGVGEDIALRVPQMRRDQAALPRRVRPEPHHRIGAPRERRQLGKCLGLHGDHGREADVVEAHLPDCVRAVRRDVSREEEGAVLHWRVVEPTFEARALHRARHRVAVATDVVRAE